MSIKNLNPLYKVNLKNQLHADLKSKELPSHRTFLPGWVLFIALALTGLATWYVFSLAEIKDQERFQNIVQRSQNTIAVRIETYIDALRGTAALFAATGRADRKTFHNYISRLELQSHYPGIQGIGYTKRITSDQTEKAVAEIRKEIPDFKIWPETPRDEVHTIIYLEPQNRRNQAALGYDMFTEPVSRAAMERARDTGLAATSGRVTLIQEVDREKQAGFLIYLPIYEPGAVMETVDQRRAALNGFVYSPFRADDLLVGIFGGETNPRVDFEVFDGLEPRPENLLYRSNESSTGSYRPRFSTITLLNVWGETWTLNFTTRPPFDLSSGRGVAPFIFIAGLLISITLFGITRSQTKARAAADRNAAELETLNQVAISLSAELDLQKLVQIVTDAGTKLSGAAFGAFFYNLIDLKGETYTLYTLSGVPREAFAKFPMPRNTAVFGPTFRGEGVVRLDDVTKDPRYGKNAPYAGMPEGHLPVKSYLAVPVLSPSGTVLGGLFFGHSAPGRFTERHERLLLSVASHAAIAIDKARILESAEQERKKAEESEQQYRLLAEIMPQLVWTSTPDGRIDWCNQRWYEATGMTIEEALQSGGLKAIHPDDRQRTRDRWKTAILTGTPHEVEFRLQSPFGGYRWYLSRGLPLKDASGRIIRWFGTCTDIDDRKRAEAEAREASRVKSEFVSNVSHELRTPLNAIIGYSSLLRDEMFGALIDDQKQPVEGVLKNGKELLNLINNLLDLSKIESGKMSIDLEKIDLVPLLEEIVSGMQPLIDEKSLSVAYRMTPLPEIESDPNKLKQIFVNLISNAIKFTERGGITLLATETPEKGGIEIAVQDTGIGIPPDELARIFDAFHQADATSTRKFGGTGLGLAIVKELTGQLNGGIGVESELDKGATFTLFLPYRWKEGKNGPEKE
ncbi:MAG: CHASE domain-containing protein [Candidatus Manganitrophus sp. SB1]|nr:CHASE domain-containing protein [Candidatus Manganitrophus morganii]